MNNKSSKILAISLIVSMVLLSSCTKANPSKVNSANNSSNQDSSVSQSSSDAASNSNTSSKSNQTSSNTNNASSDSKGYKITQKEYSSNKPNKSITLKYPQIDNSNAVNELIKMNALKPLNIYIENYEDYNITINYSVSINSSNLLSIKYSGTISSKSSAHPTNIFYTTNIDLMNGKMLSASDIINLDENLLKTLKNNGTIIINDGSKDLANAQKNSLKNLTLSNLKGSNTSVYLTGSSIGISIEVPHAIGDNMEVEVSYKNISQNINHNNKVLDNFYKSKIK